MDDVAFELKSVTLDPTVPDSHGRITGHILLSNSFTVPAFVRGLEAKPTIVHLATQFIHGTGNQDNDFEANYLVLTNAKDPAKTRGLSIADFQDSSNLDLSGVELFTLSASSTGKSNEISSTQDVESLAIVLRRRGTAAILAPLWKADGTASRMFMSSFYALWTSHPNLGKLEALRQTQLKMLNGEIGRKQISLPGLAASPDPHLGFYAHPFTGATYQLNGDFN